MFRFLQIVLLCSLLFLAVDGRAERVFILNSSYSPPHSTVEQTGYLDLILKEAFRRAGHSASIRMLPAERALRDSNAGAADGEIGRIRGISAQFPDLFIVDEPLIESRNFVAFSINHSFATTGWESLAPYHVGIMRGWKILENNVQGTRSLIKIDTTEALFRLLADDRVEVVVNARIDGLYTARKLGMEGINVMEPPLASLELYLYLHEKNRQFIPALEAALKEMKADGSYHRIRNQVLDRYLR